jgi:hypothetical protein
MANTYASVADLRELVDVLKLRVAATLPVVTESFDSDGNPVATLSADATFAAGEKGVVIRMKPTEAAYAKDILGNDALRFGPHVIQICTELGADAASNESLTPVELLPIIADIARRGANIEWYQSANGDVPATSEMTSANLKASFRPNLFDSRSSR